MAHYESKTHDGNCIFCKIVSGDIPAAQYWEDNEFMAFLSIDPNTPGFSCVIPKSHYGSDCLRLPDDLLRRFILAAKNVAGILERHYADVGRVGLVMEGTGIDHAHIKLVPMHGTEHMKRGEWRQSVNHHELWFDRYEGWLASCGGPMADPEELKRLAEELRT